VTARGVDQAEMPVMEIAHGRYQPDALATGPERAHASAQLGNGLDDVHAWLSGSAGMLRRCRLAAVAIADAGEQRSVAGHLDAPFANL
jgi:hypothetical protein